MGKRQVRTFLGKNLQYRQGAVQDLDLIRGFNRRRRLRMWHGVALYEIHDASQEVFRAGISYGRRRAVRAAMFRNIAKEHRRDKSKVPIDVIAIANAP